MPPRYPKKYGSSFKTAGPMAIDCARYSKECRVSSQTGGPAADVTPDMASNAGHCSRTDEQPNKADSDLIAKPLIKRPVQNLASWSHELPSGHPTRDLGADQMISTRDAKPPWDSA